MYKINEVTWQKVIFQVPVCICSYLAMLKVSPAKGIEQGDNLCPPQLERFLVKRGDN